MRMLESSSPVRAVHPDEALSSPSARRTERQADNSAGLEDPFAAPNPIRSSPPVLQLSCDRLGATTAEIVRATQTRYEHEISVYKFVIDAFEETCRSKIKAPEQLRLMEKATANLPKLWTALIGLDNVQLNLKDSSERAGATYANVAAGTTSHAPNETATSRHGPRSSGGRPTRTDKRVLIRIPPEEAVKQTYFGIKKHLVDTLQLKPTQIVNGKEIRTGWSVTPDTVETQQLILSEQQKWLSALNATQADKPETWYTFIVDNCPRHLPDVTGERIPLMDAAYDEIVTAAGQAPVNFHIRNKDDNSTPNAMLIVSFKEKQAGGWSLFGKSEKARLTLNRTTLAQCQKCWGYHQTTACKRTACCRNCGSRQHSDNSDNCSESPRCANCLGPHPADHTQCYARPEIIDGNVMKLSKLKLQVARRQGARDHAAAKRNRAEGPPKTAVTANQTPGTTTLQPDMEIDVDTNQPAEAATTTTAGPLETAPLPQSTTTLAVAEFHGINSQATSIYTDALTSPASPAGSPAKRKRITQATESTDEQAKQIRQSARLTKEQVDLLKPQYRPGHVRSTTARSATRSTASKGKINA